MNKIKDDLLNECAAYARFGQDMHPSRVRQMIKEAYRAGYEQAIKNYCIEPEKVKREG